MRQNTEYRIQNSEFRNQKRSRDWRVKIWRELLRRISPLQRSQKFRKPGAQRLQIEPRERVPPGF
jgi:hypothetical protein